MKKLEVRRLYLAEHFTAGQLFKDGVPAGYTLEDRVRAPGEKIPGETAIPNGVYRIEWRLSSHFGKLMPFLTHVPNFLGVTLHAGNTPAASRGCILIGDEVDFVRGLIPPEHSRPAFDRLYASLRRTSATIEVYVTEDKVISDLRSKRVEH